MESQEAEWAAGLRKREADALAQIIAAYGSSVTALVGRVLAGIGSYQDKEECASDVFVAVWNRIGEYEERRASLRTWVLILAKYKALDYRRRIISKGGSPVFDPSDDGNSDFVSTETFVIRKTAFAEAMQAIDCLDTMDRELFYKFYFYYESQESIAHDLGLTRKAVESRLRRIRQALKKQLIAAHGEEGLLWQ